MGLDGVELIMALEEMFGVEIEDNEALQVTTPGLVGDLIFSKLQQTEESYCQNQRAFHTLRNVFISTFDLKRNEVKPDTRFRNLIPQGKEQEVWLRLKKATRARSWPECVRPVWLSRSLWVISLIALGGPSIWIAADGLYNPVTAILYGILSASLVATIATRLTVPFKTSIPPSYITLADLIPHARTSETMSWTREQVGQLVQQVVVDQLGLSEEQYHTDSNFRDDYGMD